tara:strand:- start:6121 stop:6363 length:243 start_codon:yes stop_codon:yes gene_type:complete
MPKKATVTRVKTTAEDPAAVTSALREMASLFYEKQGKTPLLNVAGEGTWEDPYIVQGVTANSALGTSNPVKRASKASKKR